MGNIEEIYDIAFASREDPTPPEHLKTSIQAFLAGHVQASEQAHTNADIADEEIAQLFEDLHQLGEDVVSALALDIAYWGTQLSTLRIKRIFELETPVHKTVQRLTYTATCRQCRVPTNASLASRAELARARDGHYLCEKCSPKVAAGPAPYPKNCRFKLDDMVFFRVKRTLKGNPVDAGTRGRIVRLPRGSGWYMVELLSLSEDFLRIVPAKEAWLSGC